MKSGFQHHPDITTLMSFAAGSLPEPLAAVVSAHVSMCAQCRRELRDLERVGSVLMMASPCDEIEHPSLRSPVLTEAPTATSRLRIADGERLPPPIAATYGLAMERIPWRRLGPGVWHHRLPLRRRSDGDLRLLRILPGRTMPDHGHGGAELTLVLEGAYSDETGRYRRGDVQDVGEGVEHRPVVDSDADCICLIASERPAKFKSLIGRLLQPLTGM
jgi:putative transcriptional regulator